MRDVLARLSILVLAIVAGCGSPATGDPDAFVAIDVGARDGGAPVDGARADAGMDAASSDVGTRVDAPLDAFTTDDASPGSDTGTDAASTMDAASPTDAASTADAASAMDGGMDAASLADGGADAGGDAGSIGGLLRDNVRPRVRVEQSPTQNDPTRTTPLVWDVTFDEPIDPATLTASDFVISVTLPVTRTLVDSGDHQHFTMRLAGLTELDEVYDLSLPDSAASDPSGNPSEASTSVDGRILYDSTLATVEVRKYPPVVTYTNQLPIDFQIVFQDPITAASFDPASIVNGGTATGVTWTLVTVGAGFAYNARATAITGEGTVFPVVPAGAGRTAVGNRPTLPSVYLDQPVYYTPRPILVVTDAVADEGNMLTFNVQLQGGTSATPTLFDWDVFDGTALAGTDYVDTGAVDTTIPASSSALSLRVSALPEDTRPEPTLQFELRLRNVRGDVYVADDVAVGTIRNDDRGTWVIGGGTSSNPIAEPIDIRLDGTQLHVFGEANSFGSTVETFDHLTGAISRNLRFDGQGPGALDITSTSYFMAENLGGAVEIHAFDRTTDFYIDTFGDFGRLVVSSGSDVLEVADLAADDTHVLLALHDALAAGGASWRITCSDPVTAAPCAGFGTAGVLDLDRASGATDEGPVTVRIGTTSFWVLGYVGTAYRIEERSLATGALVSTFGSGGVLDLTTRGFVRADDFDVRAGSLYVVGLSSAHGLVAQLDATTGASGWRWESLVDDPYTITACDEGVFFGGARGTSMYLEHWALDGTALWARTFTPNAAGSGAITDVACEPGTFWLHSIGVFTDALSHRNWYYDRRYLPDGFRYTNSPTMPLE